MTSSAPCTLGVAVVSYNTRDVLAACLQSLIEAGAGEITVVDNGSTDRSAELVAERFARVRLQIDRSNRGYGAAANRGVRLSRCRAVLVLNSDTVVAPDTLRRLEDYLAAHPEAGIVGPRLTNPDGSLQPSCFPFPCAADVLIAESGAHRLLGVVPWLRERFLRTWSHGRARRVPWVSGAALAIRTEAFAAVDGFDERIFMYGEEIDLARRLATAGWETHFTPAASLMHIGGASTADQLATYPTRVRASSRFLQRHASKPTQVRFRVAMRAVMLARLVRDRVLLAGGVGDERRALAARIGTWRSVARDPGPIGR